LAALKACFQKQTNKKARARSDRRLLGNAKRSGSVKVIQVGQQKTAAIDCSGFFCVAFERGYLELFIHKLQWIFI